MFWKQKGRKSLVMGLIALLLTVSQSQADSPPVGSPSGASAQIRTDQGIESCLDRWKSCMIEASNAREDLEMDIQMKKISINAYKAEGIQANDRELSNLRALEAQLAELKIAETQSVERCERELNQCVENRKKDLQARADGRKHQRETARQQRIRTTQENIRALEAQAAREKVEKNQRKTELRERINHLQQEQASLIAEIQRMRADSIQRQGKADSTQLEHLYNQLASLRGSLSDSTRKNQRQLESLQASDKEAKDNLVAKKEELQMRKRSLRSDITGADQSATEELTRLNLQIHRLTQRLKAKNRLLESKNENINGYRTRKNQVLNERQDLRSANEQASVQIQELQRANSQSRSQQARVRDLRLEIVALRRKIHQSEQRARQSAGPEGQSPPQRHVRQELTQILKKHRDNQAIRRDTISTLQAELSSQTRTLGDLQRVIVAKQVKDRQSETQLEGERTKLMRLRAQLEECLSELAQLRKQIEQRRAVDQQTIPRPQIDHFRKKNYLVQMKQEQQEVLVRHWTQLNWNLIKSDRRQLFDKCQQFMTKVLNQILLRESFPSQRLLGALKNIYEEQCWSFFDEAWKSMLQRVQAQRSIDYIDNKMRKVMAEANKLLSVKPRSVQDCIVLYRTLLTIKKNGDQQIDRLFPALLQIYNQYCRELLQFKEIKELRRQIHGEILPYVKEIGSQLEQQASQKLIVLKNQLTALDFTKQECQAYRNRILECRCSNRNSKLLLLLDYHENKYKQRCNKTLPHSDHPNEIHLPEDRPVGSIVYYNNEFYEVVKSHTGRPVTIKSVDLAKIQIKDEDDQALLLHAQLGETMYNEMKNLPQLDLDNCKRALQYLTSQTYIQYQFSYQQTEQQKSFEALIEEKCTQMLKIQGLTSTSMIKNVIQTRRDQIISQTSKLQRLVDQITFIQGLPRPLPQNICEAFVKMIEKMKRIVPAFNLRYLSHRRIKYYVQKLTLQFTNLCPRMKEWIEPYGPENTQSRQSVKNAIRKDFLATFNTYKDKESLNQVQCRALFKAIDKRSLGRDLEDQLELLEDLYWIACEQIQHAKILTFRRRSSDQTNHRRRKISKGVYFWTFERVQHYQRFVAAGSVRRTVSQRLSKLILIHKDKLTFHEKQLEYQGSEEEDPEETFRENKQLVENAILDLAKQPKIYPRQLQCTFIAHFMADVLEAQSQSSRARSYVNAQVISRWNIYKRFFAQACIDRYPKQAQDNHWRFLVEEP